MKVTFLLLGFLLLYSIPVHGEKQNFEIVTTTAFLGDVVKGIVGDQASVDAILLGDADPHNYEPTPSDIQKLSTADVIISTGIEELDEWLVSFINDNPDYRDKLYSIDADKYLRTDPLLNTINPHYWLSPKIMRNVSQEIFDHLNSVIALDSSSYQSYLDSLDLLIADINASRQVLGGTKAIIDHPAFFYFLELLGIDRRGVIEEKEGVDPSPAHIQELVDMMKEENISLIIASKAQSSSDVIDLAARTGAKVSYLSVNPSQVDGKSYISLTRNNIDSIEHPETPETPQNKLPFPFATTTAVMFLIGILQRRRVKH